MVEDIASRISQNQDFQRLVAAAMELAAAQAGTVRNMDAAQRQEYADKAAALRARLTRDPESRQEAPFGELGELVGITGARTQALVQKAEAAARAFVPAFPELRSMDERTKLDTLTTAIKSDPILARTAEQLVATPAGAAEESPEACQAMCLALLILFMSAATAMLAVGLLGCVWLGWIPPLMVLCIMGAIAAYAAFMAIVWTVYNGCMANCGQGDIAR
ncbi:hypothetical protein [Actinomadura latina]|uniref:Uncharacterized protein n=1 Tax=Actinomadura latina TaxID=163603 RepID=A0A846Z413_9ACTN|nr:hypothetical protein [Actinomadura latina]NKZ05006.1 hypothetical protein [Actinomadura latina]